MVILNNDADLSLLAPYFTEGLEYSKGQILADLQQAQKTREFLCLLMDDGFLIGYRLRNTLFIAQLYNQGPWRDLRDSLKCAAQWARERGMTSMTGETGRDRFKAMKRLGWEQICVIMGTRI